MNLIETERLVISKTDLSDATFVLKLFNDPSWLEFIDNKGVDTLDKAREYIKNKPLAQYRKWGFGMYITRLKRNLEPIGICGLMLRDFLDDPDIGFALLSEHCGQGYATESATALIDYAKRTFKLKQVFALIAPNNKKSIRVAEKSGLKFKKHRQDPKDGSEEYLYG